MLSPAAFSLPVKLLEDLAKPWSPNAWVTPCKGRLSGSSLPASTGARG